jgi:hypothetical protein
LSELPIAEKDAAAANISSINSNIRTLRSLFSQRASAGEQNDEDETLANIQMMLEFSARCRMEDGESHNLAGFVNLNEAMLLRLSVDDLQTCSEICAVERNGTVEISRKLLMLAVQKSMRKHEPDWISIGSLYKRIIQMSTSRQEVIQQYY